MSYVDYRNEFYFHLYWLLPHRREHCAKATEEGPRGTAITVQRVLQTMMTLS